MKKKILIIGDSISLAYGKYLNEFLINNYILIRKSGINEAFENLDNVKGANIGDSDNALVYIKNEYLSNNKYDIILFNCGLHDIRVDRHSKLIQVDELKYKTNIENIVNIISKMTNKSIWINTTIINDSIHNNRNVGYLRYNKDVIKYNDISNEIMKKNNIESIDLYKFTQDLAGEIYLDHVHFKEEIVKLQAEFIAGHINSL